MSSRAADVIISEQSSSCIHRSSVTFNLEYSASRYECAIYMLFTGREVRIGKNCARGLEYGPRPQAEGRTRDRGHSFSQYGPTKAGE